VILVLLSRRCDDLKEEYVPRSPLIISYFISFLDMSARDHSGSRSMTKRPRASDEGTLVEDSGNERDLRNAWSVMMQAARKKSRSKNPRVWFVLQVGRDGEMTTLWLNENDFVPVAQRAEHELGLEKSFSASVSVKRDLMTTAHFNLTKKGNAEVEISAKRTGITTVSAVSSPLDVHLVKWEPPGESADGMKSSSGCAVPAHVIGLIRSALQKCIRLCRAGPALRVAKFMIRHATADFLRRLPIIMIEDAMLHPRLPLIVWWVMAYSKGAPMTDQDAQVILKVAYDLAAISKRDSDCLEVQNSLPSPFVSFPDPLSTASTEQLLVRSLLLRAAYGGKPWDVDILKTAAIRWNERFSSGARFTSDWIREISTVETTRILSLNQIGSIRHGDIPLSAVDFHCTGIVPAVLSQAELHISREEVEDMMWRFRSSLSNKSPIADPRTSNNIVALSTWETHLSRAVDQWSKNYIRENWKFLTQLPLSHGVRVFEPQAPINFRA